MLSTWGGTKSLLKSKGRKKKKEGENKTKTNPGCPLKGYFCLLGFKSSSTATPFSQLRELVDYRLRTHLVAGSINLVSKAYGLEYNLRCTNWTVTQWYVQFLSSSHFISIQHVINPSSWLSPRGVVGYDHKNFWFTQVSRRALICQQAIQSSLCPSFVSKIKNFFLKGRVWMPRTSV